MNRCFFIGWPGQLGGSRRRCRPASRSSWWLADGDVLARDRKLSTCGTPGTMNEYGTLAKKHWERWLPSRYAAIDPSQRDQFFTALGQEAAEAVADTMASLEAGLDRTSMSYPETVGRLNAIRQQAREIVLKELVLLEPEAEATELAYDENDQPFDLDAPVRDLLSPWMDHNGMPRDQNHELWRMAEDESVTSQEFLAAARAWEDSLWEKVNAEQQ